MSPDQGDSSLDILDSSPATDTETPMQTQPSRLRWKAAHRVARIRAAIPAWMRSPQTHKSAALGAAAHLGMKERRNGRSASVAILLDVAALARQEGRPEGARTWLFFARQFNRPGA